MRLIVLTLIVLIAIASAFSIEQQGQSKIQQILRDNNSEVQDDSTTKYLINYDEQYIINSIILSEGNIIDDSQNQLKDSQDNYQISFQQQIDEAGKKTVEPSGVRQALNDIMKSLIGDQAPELASSETASSEVPMEENEQVANQEQQTANLQEVSDEAPSEKQDQAQQQTVSDQVVQVQADAEVQQEDQQAQNSQVLNLEEYQANNEPSNTKEYKNEPQPENTEETPLIKIESENSNKQREETFQPEQQQGVAQTDQEVNTDDIQASNEDSQAVESVGTKNLIPIDNDDQQMESEEQPKNQEKMQIADLDVFGFVPEDKKQEVDAQIEAETKQFSSESEVLPAIQQGDCIIIYSQCNFKGESLEACDNLNEMKSFHHQIRSIYIPDGYSVSLYDKPGFQGAKHNYSESQSCLKTAIMMSQLNMSQNHEVPKVLTKNMKLRKHKKH